MVSLIAATGAVKLPYAGVDEPLRLENTVGADAPSVGFGYAPVGSSEFAPSAATGGMR